MIYRHTANFKILISKVHEYMEIESRSGGVDKPLALYPCVPSLIPSPFSMLDETLICGPVSWSIKPEPLRVSL